MPSLIIGLINWLYEQSIFRMLASPYFRYKYMKNTLKMFHLSKYYYIDAKKCKYLKNLKAIDVKIIKRSRRFRLDESLFQGEGKKSIINCLVPPLEKGLC